MADFGSPVAQNVNVNPNQGLQTISSLIGLRQQQQNLQTGQYQQQSAQAMAVQDQQKAKETQGIAQLLQNPIGNGILKQDGTPAPDAMSKIMAVAPTTGAIRADEIFRGAQSKVAFDTSLNSLTEEQRGSLAADMSAAAASGASASETRDLLANHAQQNPALIKGALIMSSMLPKDPTMTGNPQTDQAARAQYAKQLTGIQTLLGRAAMGPANAGSLNTVNTSAVSTGAKTNLIQTTPGGAVNNAGSLTNTIPPGMSTFTDQAGNTWAVNPQNPGHAVLVGHGGSIGGASGGAKQAGATPSSPSTTPGAPPVMAVGGAQNATQSAMNDEQTYSHIRDSANQAPVTKNILSSIEALAGESKTGAGSKDLATAETVVSQYFPGFKAAGDAATNRQLLGKYVQQLALRTVEANGAGTDAAKATVASAIPDPDHMTPEAIQKAARFIQSQTQISQARGAVAEKYRSEHGGSSQGLRAVDSAFMQNVDPRAFDFMSLPQSERGPYLQKNFPDAASREKFASQLSVIDHYGGFNYAKQ